MKLIAYTDGSYDMQSHYGASAIVILDENEHRKLYEWAKARKVEPTPEKQQFCQEQELGACIRAVMSVPNGCYLTIKTDSQYCCKVLGGDWEPRSNLLLIDRFFEETKKRHIRVSFSWVKGHSGNAWNEHADSMCVFISNQLAAGGPSTAQTENCALKLA